jgi:hypothetical protein
MKKVISILFCLFLIACKGSNDVLHQEVECGIDKLLYSEYHPFVVKNWNLDKRSLQKVELDLSRIFNDDLQNILSNKTIHHSIYGFSYSRSSNVYAVLLLIAKEIGDLSPGKIQVSLNKSKLSIKCSLINGASLEFREIMKGNEAKKFFRDFSTILSCLSDE